MQQLKQYGTLTCNYNGTNIDVSSNTITIPLSTLSTANMNGLSTYYENNYYNNKKLVVDRQAFNTPVTGNVIYYNMYNQSTEVSGGENIYLLGNQTVAYSFDVTFYTNEYFGQVTNVNYRQHASYNSNAKTMMPTKNSNYNVFGKNIVIGFNQLSYCTEAFGSYTSFDTSNIGIYLVKENNRKIRLSFRNRNNLKMLN